MKIKRKAYISLEVVFLLTIMVISGMYVTIKLFNKGHNVSGQEAEAFSKVNHTVNNAINVGSSGGGGSGGGGGGSTPSEPTGVIDTIYWGIDASGKLIISDVQVAGAVESGSFAGNTVFYEGETGPTTPWFPYADSITSIKVEKNNRKVAPASTAVWFGYLRNVSNIDVTNLDTSNVTNMFGTFGGCGLGATTLSIEGLETWDTSNVTDMAFMFINCMAEELDLSNWNVAKVETFEKMFSFSIGLRTIKTPKNIPSTVDITNITSSDLWDISDNNTIYTAGTFPVGNGNASHTLSLIGPDGLSETIYWGVDEKSETLFITDLDIGCPYFARKTCGSFSYDDTFVEYYSQGEKTPWVEYGWRSTIKNIVVHGNVAPTNTNYWFNSLYYVENIDVSGLNTSRATSMMGMFDSCGSYASTFAITGLENWDTSNVTNMEAMFAGMGNGAKGVKLDLTNWSTSSLVDGATDEMFCNTGSEGDVIIKYIDKFRPYSPYVDECIPN